MYIVITVGTNKVTTQIDTLKTIKTNVQVTQRKQEKRNKGMGNRENKNK